MRLDDTLVPSILEKPKHVRRGLRDYLPAIEWLGQYERRDLSGDVIAGAVVAVMLVPQAMAYSNLAGLPPQLGLYSSIAALFLCAVFSTSRFLSVGPVAIVSVLTAAGVGQLAAPGSDEYVGLAVTLSLLVGLIQFIMGFFRIGFIVNFISHPVFSGFMSAAAVIIVASQLKTVLGLSLPYSEKLFVTLPGVYRQLYNTNYYTFALGAGGVAFLLFFPTLLKRLSKRLRLAEPLVEILTKSAPLLLVVASAAAVWFLQLNVNEKVAVVGAIPAGLPHLVLPPVGYAQSLLPIAFAIAFVGFMESYSVAATLGGKRGQKIEPNQELIALGAANLGATFLGGYSVTGSFSRSMVNFMAGASTQLSSIVTVVLIVVTVTFLMPLFYYLPQATLAAVILVAVKDLFDAHGLRHIWNYSRADGYSWFVTFFSILIFDIQVGILIGAIAAITLYLWRTSQPHVVVVGRVGNTEHFRSVSRYDVTTFPSVLAVRVDENLYFANTKYLEDYLFYTVLQTGQIQHLVLILSGVNFIDVSALDTLEKLVVEMKALGITVYLAEIKGRTMDKIEDSDFINAVGRENVFLTAHEAMSYLGC
ncbi:MAG: sulfate permease [Acidobacteria bacterium]|nr:sulfate permease [Acidobacteriota bacterium]